MNAEIQVPQIAEFPIPAPVDDCSMRSLPESTPPTNPEETRELKTPPCLFVTLPNELHDMILENIFGDCPSGFPLKTTGRDTLEGWQVALRHPRRKELSNLALVCRQWTYLVQSRIYKNSMSHELLGDMYNCSRSTVRIPGTYSALALSAEWLTSHPTLQNYIQHIDVWFPVWGKRVMSRFRWGQAHTTDTGNRPPVEWGGEVHFGPRDHSFYCATANTTMEEVIGHIKMFYPKVHMVTLEAGNCRESAMVRYFKAQTTNAVPRDLRFPVVRRVQTLIMHGSWNLIRDCYHWDILSRAFPMITQWHCTFAQIKGAAYFHMSHLLQKPLWLVRHLNLDLGGLSTFRESPMELEGSICQSLGRAAAHLISLTYNGKLCASFWEALSKEAKRIALRGRLQTLNLSLQNCCAPKMEGNSSWPPPLPYSGVGNMQLVWAFEAMVLGCMESLGTMSQLNWIKIRYVDIDSHYSVFSPYFELVNRRCEGIWSEQIVAALAVSRPSAHFVEMRRGIEPKYDENGTVKGVDAPTIRPRSIEADAYQILADLAKN